MSLHLAKTQSPLQACAARLELEWVDWPDSWESFEAYIRRRGDDNECTVLDTWPKEFKAAAIARSKRIENWQTNKLRQWLDKMDRLTEAKKAMQVRNEDGSSSLEFVDDNTTQIAALKFLIENVMGAAAAKSSPQDMKNNPHQGIKIDAVVVSQLEQLGVRLSDERDQRAIEFRSGVEPRRHSDSG